MLNQDQCRQIISNYLKDQSTRSIHRRLRYAQAGKMDYIENCLLGLSDLGVANLKVACKERLRLGLPEYSSEAPPDSPERAFYYLGHYDNDEKNRLMVDILEAELLRRELESSPPVDTPPADVPAEPLEPAEPQPVSDSELVELFS